MARRASRRAVIVPAAGLALAALAVPAAVSAQAGGPDSVPAPDPAPLVGDRPDFTESASVVGRLQLEMGYSVEADHAADTHALGELLVRVPLARRLELRVGVPSWSWVREDRAVAGTGPDDPAGFADAAVGVKVGLREAGPGDGGPAVALLAGATVPTGGEVGSDGVHPEGRFAAAVPLGGRLSLAANAGVASGEAAGTRYAELSGSVSLGIGVSEEVGAYLEGYGFVPTGDGPAASSVVNGGLTWLAGPHLQLDVRLGAGMSGPAPDLVFGTGVVWRP